MEPNGFVVDERATAHGVLVLRSHGSHFEIISDGMFLMDTRNGDSERLLVSEALSAAARPRSVLLGGLGVGFSLEEALDFPGVDHVTVVELHGAIIDWNRTHFRARMDHRLKDQRLSIVCYDLTRWLQFGDSQFDAICLDVDNGPGWLSVPSNAVLYGEAGIAALARRLRPGGVLAVWSADRSNEFETRLCKQFAEVASVEVPVQRGVPDVIYLARHDLGAAGAAATHLTAHD